MAIWHPGSGITYSEYLKTNSLLRDIKGQIKTSGKSFKANISEQTKQLVASNQELARTFGEGFNSINSTLVWGFNCVGYALEDVNVSIESLHADFNYNMGLLLEELNTQSKLLSSLLNKLDAIHKTLESPTLTQAREFYHIGCERLSKRLLDKALEAFIEAEKKNDTDFFTQFRIGNLYLNGRDEDDNLLDYEKAKHHLLLAVRYAKAELKVDPSFAHLAARALLLASIAIYVQLGEKHILGIDAKTNTLLKEARKLVSDAIELHPAFSEALYHSAKYSALLAESQTSIPNLEKAIVIDRNYAVKVDVDHAFDPVRPHVLALLHKLKESKKIESQTKIAQAEQNVNAASLWHLDESAALKTGFDKCKQDLSSAQDHYKSDTYFGFLDAIALAESVIRSAPVLRSQRIDELKYQVSNIIKDAKTKLPESGKYSEEVEEGIFQTNELITKAENQLSQTNYESFKAAISTARAASDNASAARKRSNEEDEEQQLRAQRQRKKEERQDRRNEASKNLAGPLAFCGGLIGSVTGCVNCIKGGDFNLWGGAIFGAIAGAILGFIIGQLKS